MEGDDLFVGEIQLHYDQKEMAKAVAKAMKSISKDKFKIKLEFE